MNDLPGGIPNIFAPRGIAAAHIAQLGWVLIVVATIVFVLVMIALLAPVARRPRHPLEERGASTPREHSTVLILGALVPALVLAAVYVFSLRDIGMWSDGADARADVEVIGHQWWWEVRYPGYDIVTANEIHIPTGTKVRVALVSSDVNHSFWVPQLHGKLDLIPGQVNRFWIEADSAGMYRGECAEFCGTQHARMDFTVISQPGAEFARWVTAQRAPEGPPADPAAAEGRQVFQQAGCAFCHTVGGNGAGGKVGPDLTHFASRLTIAAGAYPNTRGYLAGWIVDAQHMKPGVRMPDIDLSGEELQALLAYLDGLK